MASEELYCMECVEGRPVALGLCADCLAGEPLEEVIRQIARLSRELEEARKMIRELVDDEDAGLVWLGRRLVCAYCTADGLYSVDHAADCPIIRARRAIAALRSEAQEEDRWEDLVFGPITEAYNEAHDARRGEGGGK
jgi:hypothetical protein